MKKEYIGWNHVKNMFSPIEKKLVTAAIFAQALEGKIRSLDTSTVCF